MNKVESKIKFVYFDVGGVVIKDFSGSQKWIDMKRDLGITESTDNEFDEFYDLNEIDICRGKDPEFLLPIIQKKFAISLPPSYSLTTDVVSRFEKNEDIWSLLLRTREKYKVGLLTNMYPGMFEEVAKKKIMPEIIWDVIIDSSKVGFQKPDDEIYKIAERRSGVSAGEIFFVDNTKGHIEKAKVMGWNALWYDFKNQEKSIREIEEILFDK